MRRGYLLACVVATAAAAQCSGGGGTTDGGSTEASADVPGCSSDVTTDPHNCGRCGHDCLGGGCVAGVCQPVVLAYGVYVPTELALDAKNVYITTLNGTSFFRVPKSGGAMVPLECDGGPVVEVATGSRLYVRVQPPGIFPLYGGVYASSDEGATFENLAMGFVYVDGSAPVGNTDYDKLATGASGTFSVQRHFPGNLMPTIYTVVHIADDGGEQAVQPASSFPGSALATNGTTVAFGDNHTVYLFPADGTDAGVSLYCSDTAFSAVVMDSTHLYWANGATGSVLRIALSQIGTDAAVPEYLAIGQGEPTSIAVDQSNVYFTTSLTGTVAACSLSGCLNGPQVLARDQVEPQSIAVDDQAVYWVTNPGGTVVKVAK